MDIYEEHIFLFQFHGYTSYTQFRIKLLRIALTRSVERQNRKTCTEDNFYKISKINRIGRDSPARNVAKRDFQIHQNHKVRWIF